MATEVNKILLDIEIDSKGVISNLDQVQSKLKGLGVDMDKTGKQFSNFGKAAKDGASSAGIAGAAAAELGRTISDLPFGINAITNNISQLGSMFSLLVVKTGSFSKALGALGKVMTGPAGLLILFQIAVAALEFFSKRQQKATKDVLDFNNSVESQIDALDEVSRAFDDLNVSEEKRIDLLEKSKILGDKVLEAYKQEALTRREISNLAALERDAAKAKEELEKNNTKRTEERKKLQEELLDVSKSEERLERRRNNLRRQGFGEEQIALETANQAAEVAKERRTVEGEIAKIKEQQRLEEEGIYKTLQDAQKIRELAQQRLSAEQELTKERFDLQSKILELERKSLDQSGVQVVEQQRENQRKIYELALKRLDDEKKRELQNITDPKTIDLIREKYRVLSESAALDFKSAIEGIKFEKIPVEFQPMVSFKDLIDPPQTEAQKWASKQLETYSKAIEGELVKREESKGERNFFLDTFGISEENLQAGIAAAQTALNTLGDVFSAQAEREIAVETNRTNQLNDQLKQRLANEQLSADERDKINQEIARNEAQLVAKENQINKKRFEQEKAVNIALATVNTFSAATGVLAETKGGTFARIAGMIAVIGAGLAQVAIIAKQQFTAKAMPSPNLSGLGGAGGAGGAEPQFNVIGATGQNQLAAAIAATQQQPVKAYVVSNDVTTAQSLDRNIVAEASL
jgi:hypothetical protein